MDEATAGEDDAALVARCRAGDASAWSALVARYQALVYTVARTAGLDDHAAADVFQTVFARLFEQLGRLREPGRLQAWIVTTAKREVIAIRRRQARNVSIDDDAGGDGPTLLDTLADDAPLADERLAELQLLHRLRVALDALDERCRRLLDLLFAADEDRPAYGEVSARLGLPVGSIGPTRARCLAKLRALLAKV